MPDSDRETEMHAADDESARVDECYVDNFGVVIATYGDMDEWLPLVQRAARSVAKQTVPPDVVIWKHGETLASARNDGANECSTDFVIFLDADDELDEHYIEALQQAKGDIRRPCTLGVHEDGHEDDFPVMIPERDIRTANYIVIGAAVDHWFFDMVGGFEELPILEDWALFQRLILQQNAVVTEVPDAIYKVHVGRQGQRNENPNLHGEIYTQLVGRWTRG